MKSISSICFIYTGRQSQSISLFILSAFSPFVVILPGLLLSFEKFGRLHSADFTSTPLALFRRFSFSSCVKKWAPSEHSSKTWAFYPSSVSWRRHRGANARNRRAGATEQRIAKEHGHSSQRPHAVWLATTVLGLPCLHSSARDSSTIRRPTRRVGSLSAYGKGHKATSGCLPKVTPLFLIFGQRHGRRVSRSINIRQNRYIQLGTPWQLISVARGLRLPA